MAEIAPNFRTVYQINFPYFLKNVDSSAIRSVNKHNDIKKNYDCVPNMIYLRVSSLLLYSEVHCGSDVLHSGAECSAESKSGISAMTCEQFLES
jgi:hypothetical protein